MKERIEIVPVFLLFLIISGCGPSKTTSNANAASAQLADSVVSIVDEVPEVDPHERGIPEMTIAFSEALLEGKTGELEKYYSNVSVARKLSPDATRDKSDEAIYKEMIAPLYQRFDAHLNSIRIDMQAHDINPADVKLKDYSIDSSTLSMIPMVMNINFKTPNSEVAIPVTFARVGHDLYIFEILNSTGLFD